MYEQIEKLQGKMKAVKYGKCVKSITMSGPSNCNIILHVVNITLAVVGAGLRKTGKMAISRNTRFY